eukprot:scaffold167175_cov42-Cyclotella_meneghiniana.AAC.3
MNRFFKFMRTLPAARPENWHTSLRRPPDLMFGQLFGRNGTTKTNSTALNPNDDGSTASSILASENNGSFAPSPAVATLDGRTISMTVRASSSPPSAISGSTASSAVAEGSNEGTTAPPLEDSGGRGVRRGGTLAQDIDFTSQASIEENIPPYSGKKRYGQLPFPLSRLLDDSGNVLADKKTCYQLVTAWRRLTPKEQAKEMKIEDDIRKAEKKAEKKRQQEAKKKQWNDTSNKNRKAKRKKAAEDRKKAAEDDAAAAAEEPINSQLLDAARFADDSACAAIASRKSKRRKQSEPIQQKTQVNDRASQRATQQVVRTFGKAQQTLSVAPNADTRGWPKPNENMMLVHRTAVGTSTQQVDVHVTNGSPGEIFSDLLTTGQFNNRLSQWLAAQGLSIRNADGSVAVLPAPPATSTAAASTESTAAAAVSTAAATNPDDAAADDMPPLPPVGPILYSTQELDELAG